MSRIGARKPSSTGLTLVEVLMSVALLAGGTVLIMQAFARAWHAAVVVDDRATAYRFALSKLADLELLQRQGRDVPEEDTGTFRAGARKFQWTLTSEPDARDPEARHVVFSVVWPRGRSTDQATYELLCHPRCQLMTMPSVCHRRAFTLVELLVTVSLVAMVGGTVVAAVSGCLRVWERLRGAGQRDQWVQVAFDEMRTQLRSQRRFKPIPVEGAYDSLVFAGLVTTDPPEGLGVPEVGRVGYYFDASRHMLCRSTQPYRLIRQRRLREMCHPILTDVDRVRFAYFGPGPASKTAGWSTSWSSEEPPLAVKVEVGYDERTTRRPVTQTLLVDVPLATIR